MTSQHDRSNYNTLKIKVAPSILAADFANMGQAVRDIQRWGADYIHFDVMDGAFVNNLELGPMMCAAVKPYSTLSLDVHLMVERPYDYVERFVNAGANIITFHVEADKHIHHTLQYIHSFGIKAGVVLNPATPAIMVEPVVADCDMVTVMSVNPGEGGQSFIHEVLKKVTTLRRWANERGLDLDIEMDGGINPQTAALCRAAGANVLVSGSYIFQAQEPAAVLRQIRGNEQCPSKII